jgi:hypothetical protein
LSQQANAVSRRAKFLEKLSQGRLLRAFALFDGPARQTYLAGVIQHVGRTQDHGNMPLICSRIE